MTPLQQAEALAQATLLRLNDATRLVAQRRGQRLRVRWAFVALGIAATHHRLAVRALTEQLATARRTT